MREENEGNKAVLYGKMAKVMGRLTRIREIGEHSQGWKYATSEDVKDAVRVAMSEEGLALLVGLEDYEVIGLEKGVIVRGRMAFTLCCSETGVVETRYLVGEASDQTKVSDKAFYKLYTALTKYFLRTTFLISSGGELDSDADIPAVTRNSNGEMNLGKLLVILDRVEKGDKVEYIKGFYTPVSIMDCRGRGAEPPAPDDTEGWRNLFVDARDHAFEQIERAAEEGKIPENQTPMTEARAVQSAMDEVEEDAHLQLDSGQIEAERPGCG